MPKIDVEIVADELLFPEGPVWLNDGSVLVVEVLGGRITRVGADGTKHLVANTGGGPNGAAIGPDGKIYVCNNGLSVRGSDGGPPPPGLRIVDHAGGNFSSEGAASVVYEGGRIERVDITTGAVERLYTCCDDRPLSAPNDIVFDGDGGFWFTDRGRNNATSHDHGGLYYARADCSCIIRAVDRLSCNGVGLSPDGRTLYTALTDERHLLAYDIQGPGQLAPVGNYVSGRLVASLPGRQFLDSLAVMANGMVAQAVIWEESGIAIIDPDTGAMERLDFHDHFTTNICFGGDDMCDAWVTLSQTGKLIKTRWSSPGLRLEYSA